jgi:DNA-binding transcriptional LysR family regulator
MVPKMRPLDPEAVQAFVHIADLKSFTRAAEALGKTQSTISLKVQRLEASLGRRLPERTPRSVRLSTDGQAFIGPARDFLSAYDRAAEAFEGNRHRVVLGISHHLVGPDFPLILKHMNDVEPSCVIDFVGITRFGSQVVSGGNTVHSASANSMVRKIGHW